MFERYADFIPDFAGFNAALARPRDRFIRANALRIDPAEFRRLMKGAGYDLAPLPWFPAAFLAPPELARAPATLEYFLGLYYVQGAASMVPPLALAPERGDRVLDLCAAPGSKTTQMCEMMGNEGLVVANEVFVDRLKILKGHLERLGIACAVITRRPGESFPSGIRFRRVLVDAPCTGEGTLRAAVAAGRPPDGPESAEESYPIGAVERLHRLQRSLLRRAANLCEPGGAIVYSTCTYSPLENEVVIEDVLAARPDLEIEEIRLDVPADPGLTEWEGRRFRPEMRRCLRFYPHRGLNSWGFFVARLRRRPDARPSEKERRRHESAPPAPPGPSPSEAAEARSRATGYFAERFGIAGSAFERYAVHRFGASTWLASRALPHPETLAALAPQNPGLRLLRHLDGKEGAYEKPTSRALRVVGAAATRAVADLDESELWPFLRGEPIGRPFDGLKGGYAIVRFKGHVIGCGLMTAGGLVSQIPLAESGPVRRSLFLSAGAERP